MFNSNAFFFPANSRGDLFLHICLWGGGITVIQSSFLTEMYHWEFCIWIVCVALQKLKFNTLNRCSSLNTNYTPIKQVKNFPYASARHLEEVKIQVHFTLISHVEFYDHMIDLNLKVIQEFIMTDYLLREIFIFFPLLPLSIAEAKTQFICAATSVA